MKFLSYLIEKYKFNNNEVELASMKKFKTIFGDDVFKVKGFKFKFTNHAAHRYLERFQNESKLYLLDQLKKIGSELHGKENNLYFFKLKSINKGFIIQRINNQNAQVVTVYGNDMDNKRKTTETIILESFCEIIEI